MNPKPLQSSDYLIRARFLLEQVGIDPQPWPERPWIPQALKVQLPQEVIRWERLLREGAWADRVISHMIKKIHQDEQAFQDGPVASMARQAMRPKTHQRFWFLKSKETPAKSSSSQASYAHGEAQRALWAYGKHVVARKDQLECLIQAIELYQETLEQGLLHLHQYGILYPTLQEDLHTLTLRMEAMLQALVMAKPSLHAWLKVVTHQQTIWQSFQQLRKETDESTDGSSKPHSGQTQSNHTQSNHTSSELPKSTLIGPAISDSEQTSSHVTSDNMSVSPNSSIDAQQQEALAILKSWFQR